MEAALSFQVLLLKGISKGILEDLYPNTHVYVYTRMYKHTICTTCVRVEKHSIALMCQSSYYFPSYHVLHPNPTNIPSQENNLRSIAIYSFP